MPEWLADPNPEHVAHYGEPGGRALCWRPCGPVVIPANAIPSQASARVRCMGCVEKRLDEKCPIGRRPGLSAEPTTERSPIPHHDQFAREE
jgi:hypothetical protein